MNGFVLILREKTERTEIVENKVGQLVGVEGQKIFICASKKIDDSSRNALNKKYLYGKGHAAEKIEKIIAQYLKLFPNELDCSDAGVYSNFRSHKDITYVSATTENVQARYVTDWLREKCRYG